MNRTLNLKTAKRPSFELVLDDANETIIHMTIPTLAMFKEMQEVLDDIGSIDESNPEALEAMLDFVARLMSCNREGLVIKGEELTGKYNMDFESLLLVLGEYASFLTDILKAKN